MRGRRRRIIIVVSCSNVNSPKVSILRKEGARNRNCYGKKRKKKSGREREREKKAEVL